MFLTDPGVPQPDRLVITDSEWIHAPIMNRHPEPGKTNAFARRRGARVLGIWEVSGAEVCSVEQEGGEWLVVFGEYAVV